MGELAVASRYCPPMFSDPQLLQTSFDQGLSYADFVALGEPEGQHLQWHERHSRLELTPDQDELVRSFVRPMRVLSLTGTWCGDCALQGAAMQRIAEASPSLIDLRFVLRAEQHAELVVKNALNGGFRVPVTWFMAEDGAPCSRIGDRPLSRYRAMARRALGDDAVLAPPEVDPVRAVLGELLDEFERVQLMLRVSPRWREHYGD